MVSTVRKERATQTADAKLVPSETNGLQATARPDGLRRFRLMSGERQPELDPESRFQMALAKAADEKLRVEGLAWLWDEQIAAVANEQGLPDHRVGHVVEKLADEGLIWEKSTGFFDAISLVGWFEEDVDRQTFRERNALRREVLELAAQANDRGEELVFLEGERQFIERSWLEVVCVVRLLADWRLVELREALGHSFWLEITHRGYELVRNEDELRRTLPVSAADDEAAHAPVVADALEEVITSCDQMLERRNWVGALAELRRGDNEYDKGDWVDAVSEYYAAVESGLKHRLEEVGASYREGDALRDLARRAVDARAIPINYQALFGFLDSVRSPRRHGRGSRPEEVEVGPAEALLMKNHARSLLLYLGHRPEQ